MRTIKTIAIALIALATSAGTQTAQAHGKEEQDYLENLFAITWYQHSSKHSLYLMHWQAEAWISTTFAELPIEGKQVKVFNKDGQIIHNALFGYLQLDADTSEEASLLHNARHEKENYSIVFYLQLAPNQKFDPNKAMKLEVFPNRRIARIALHDGFQRIVPVQRYSIAQPVGQARKNLPTAINFGPIE